MSQSSPVGGVWVVNNARGMSGLLSLLFVVLSCISVIADGDDREPESTRASLMERKLGHAQAVLSALAREDFDALGVNADALLELSEEQWISRDTPEYRAQLKDFWVVLEGIRDAGDEENLDGATIAYVQMTLSCVRCHKYLRSNPE